MPQTSIGARVPAPVSAIPPAIPMSGPDITEVRESTPFEAIRAELVTPQEDSYRFIHDRVQEAAYSLIPEESRAETHLGIGRLLVAHTPPEKREEAIFEIVNQLNRGVALITSRDEREQLAELNLIAGKRAKASTAYASALTYLTTGLGLLPDDAWERLHELKFALELHRAECEFLTGELALAEERLIVLSNRGADETEQATVACLRIDLYAMTDLERCPCRRPGVSPTCGNRMAGASGQRGCSARI